MSMANTIPIKYRGETLCCLDQTEVKAVEPFRYKKYRCRNLWMRLSEWVICFVTGRIAEQDSDSYEDQTKILFKDGTWIRIKIPFMEFVNGYV